MSCNCGYKKRLNKYKTNYDSKRSVYMDYNATTPVDPQTLGEFDRACRRLWANPSSLHGYGALVDDELDKARNIIKNFFKTNNEILFCNNGSEAIHAGLNGLVLRNKDITIITTCIEHSAVKHPLVHLHKAGYKVKTLNVNGKAELDLDNLKNILEKSNKSLLIFSPVNHETGSLQPLEDIFNITKKHDCIVFYDAVQAIVRLGPGWSKYCDIFAVSGHKLYAPKGTGFLAINKKIRIRPSRFGGFQEQGIFPGTQNTPGILSLSKAISILNEQYKQENKFLERLTNEGIEILNDNNIDFIVESPENRAPGILCISFPGIENIENLLFSLNRDEIYLSRFSACTPFIDTKSKVLNAMGIPAERSMKSIRISLGRWSKRDDFFRLAKSIRKYLN